MSDLSGFHLVVVTLSGVGGSVLHVFDTLEGTIIHEKRLHHPQNGQLYSQRSLGVDVAFDTLKTTEDEQEARDLFVLTIGLTVHRIDGTRSGHGPLQNRCMWVDPFSPLCELIVV